MADKYQTLDTTTGKRKLVEGTVTSTGVAQAGDIVALDAAGKLDISLLPVGVAADVKLVTVSTGVTLAAGDYVNFWDNTGEEVRLADHSNNRPAHGFVLAGYTAGQTATVYFEGANTALSGLTPGARQYLDTNGDATETPKTTGLHQLLGVAISATEINTDIQDCITIS